MRTMAVVTLLALVVTVAVAQPVTITGRVVGPDGEGVAGARVATVLTLTSPLNVEWVETTSADDGSFEFNTPSALPDGTTFVVASAEGLGVWGAMTRGGAPIEIRLTDDLSAISGTIRDTAGQPIEGATVRVIALLQGGNEEPGAWMITWEGAPQAVSDAEGRFTIGGLPAGTRAALQTEGEGFASVMVTEEDDWPVIGEAEEITLTMHPQSFIAGRVTHEGQPVEGVAVSAVAMQPPISWSNAVTDADGRYEIGGLAGGSFVVMPQPPEGLMATSRDSVTVPAGGRAEGIDFQLSTGALVRGRVTWQDTGEPVAGTTVILVGDTGVQNRAQTDEDGRYELRIPAGTHSLQWMAPPVDARGAEPSQQEVTVATDDVRERVDFALLRKKTIVLTVLGPDGQPVPGASVWWDAGERYGSPEMIEPVLTDEQGQARLLYGRQNPPTPMAELPPPVIVVVQEVERGLAGMAHFDAEAEDALTIRLEAGGFVEADVQDQNGGPLEGIQFRAISHGQYVYYPELPLRMSTDADGRLRAGPLPPNVSLEIAPSWQHRSVTLQPRATEMPVVELAPGETAEIGPFIIAPAGMTVRGRVIDAAGNPVVGAIVVSANGVNWTTVRDEADAEGLFELKRIGTDEEIVTIIAAAPDGSGAWAEPVDPTIAFEPTIQLAAPGMIIATIRGADGQPVEGVQVQLDPQDMRTLMDAQLPGGLVVQVDGALTDAEGRARFEHLVPGVEYFVHPAQDGWTGGPPMTIYGPEPVEIEITLGE
ncbi:MAG TPA: hypothetical protein DEP45_09650 [Armatimonadetes bacterium]|nr:hypothetical protein [Armatimonadota bacterium]